MEWFRVSDLLLESNVKEGVVVKGWVRTRRDSKGFTFLEINDGSCRKNIQAIVNDSISDHKEMEQITTGASVIIEGNLIESLGKGQAFEIEAQKVSLVGKSPSDYPLQKKRHGNEFLRTIAHLRPRTNLFGSVFRVRSELSYAIHKFFHERGFFHVNSPIISTSDCEGAGEMFRVTTLDINSFSEGKIDFNEDFFGKEAFLTVSGQLEAEIMALALGKVYTFGPTFRAENSNTVRHVSEIQMVEPEMAFYDLKMDMDLAEEFTKYFVKHVVENCSEDMELFFKFVDKGLEKSLRSLIDKGFGRISYTDAVKILEKENDNFEFNVCYGSDLQSEHERFLAEKYFKGPVIVYDYPKEIKAFYMRSNDDNKTVAAMDVLVPRVGELFGGSQREERYDVLVQRIRSLGLNPQDYWWYLDLRKFGTVPHSGFGLGFDRTVMYLTGLQNIRDVIPFPRTPKNAEF